MIATIDGFSNVHGKTCVNGVDGRFCRNHFVAVRVDERPQWIYARETVDVATSIRASISRKFFKISRRRKTREWMRLSGVAVASSANDRRFVTTGRNRSA
jgi:hypothetical protein